MRLKYEPASVTTTPHGRTQGEVVMVPRDGGVVQVLNHLDMQVPLPPWPCREILALKPKLLIAQYIFFSPLRLTRCFSLLLS